MKMKEVRNQMTERVLDLTVEMIFLLTGEDYIVLKRPGEPERPGSRPLVLQKPHSPERERHSEQQILELTHRILRLLTGEVPTREAATVQLPKKQWDSADEIHILNENMMCEDDPPLRSVAKRANEEQLETGDRTKPLDVNDPPYKRVANREAESTVAYGELPESDAGNPTDHPQTEYLSAHINEEATSRDSDADLYLPTERTQTKPTSPARITDEASAKSNLTDGDIRGPTKCTGVDCTVSDGKEAPDSCEEGNFSDEDTEQTQVAVLSVSVKEESASCGQGRRTDTDVCKPTEDTDTEYPSGGIKEESVFCKGEDLSDTDTEYPPTHVKEESASCDGGDLSDEDIYSPTEHTPVFMKKETASFDGGNLTHPEVCTAMEDSEIEYSCIDIKEESVSCDEGDFSDTDIYPYEQTGYSSPHIKEEPASSEEGNDVDEDLEYHHVYIKEESQPSDEEFFTDNDTYTKTGSADRRHVAHASPSVMAFPCNSGTAEQTSILTGEKQFSCSECGKFFTTKSNLLAHHRVHTGEKKFSCSECGKYFTAKSSLSAHQRIHTGEKRFCCPVCGKRFTASSCLIAHKRIHTGEKPYACSICGRCFTTNSSLFTHQRTHTGEKPFSCSACGKCFTTNSGLVTHRRSHTGEKPFSCSECGKRFSKTSNLISHKRLHTGEKPFSCLECGKSFISKAYLIIHEKIHMQDKPFSCTICGRCFSQKSSVYRHQRTHANEKNDNLND